MSEVNKNDAEGKLPENEQIEENAAADSVKMTKVDIIGQVVKSLNGMTVNDLSDWHTRTFANFKAGQDSVPDGAAAKNKSSVDMKGTAKGAVKEEVEALVSELPEDFRVKAVTLVESAITLRVAAEIAEREAELQEDFETELETIREELTTRVEQYLEAAADAWIEENAVAIESSIRNEHTEKLLEALRGVLADLNVDLPEERVDALEAAESRVKDLEERLNEAAQSVIDLTDELKKRDARATFEKVAEGLALTDKERFKTLVEDVDVDENLEEKLTVIREANFKKTEGQTKVGKEVIGEEVVVVIDEDAKPQAKPISENMKPYVSTMKRLIG
jgi:hypothetical protein